MADMNPTLFDIDRADLQVVVNKFVPGTGLAWKSLFPLKYTRRFDLKGLEGDEGIAVSADRVAFNVKAPLKSREKVGSWSGKLSKIAVSREKDEEEINEYNDLKVLAASNDNAADATELVEMRFNDVDFCDKAMNAKIEIDALRIGSSGVQTFDATIDGENATADTIDFNVPSSNKKGAAVAWTTESSGVISVNTSADGLKDIADAQEAIAALGYPKPMFAIMEKQAFNALRGMQATANRLFPQAKSLSLITSDMISLEAINAYMAQNGYPQIVFIDSYVRVEGKNGEKTVVKPWNPNVVTLAPTLQLGWTYYKTVPETPNTSALQVQGAFYKTTRYSEVNPLKEVTMSEAYVQPGLINRKSTVFLNTANTSWNGGAR